jgi:hypothetical protein
MSEASAFLNESKVANADHVYSTLRTSANSRFPNRFKGMIMSWPRFDPDVDFTMTLIRDNKNSTTIWTDVVAPWDYKPERYYDGTRFAFELDGQTHMIPIEHKEEFEKYPEDSCSKYLCRPSKAGRAVIAIGDISKAVHNFPSLLEFESLIGEGKVRLLIKGFENRAKFIGDFLVTIDLGKTMAAAALALQHWDSVQGYVLDAIGAWAPDQKKGIIVDMLDVEEKIKYVCSSIPRVRVAFDHWNPELYVARLKGQGYDAFQYQVRSLHGQDYDMLQKGIASNLVHLVNHKELLLQLSALRMNAQTNETYLEPKIATRKDHVDVVTGGFKILLAEAQTGNRMGGTFIGNNLGQMGGSVIGRNI